MPYLLRGRMGWAFAGVVDKLFTRLSTGLVDNLSQPSNCAGLPEKTMKTPRYFARYQALAQRFIKAGRLPSLLFSVARKREGLGKRFADFSAQLRSLQALCLAWWRGDYRAISTPALLAVVGALLYFITPLDGLPDWLLGIGLLDDLAILAWVARIWRDELSTFELWRASQSAEVILKLEQLPACEQQLLEERGHTSQ
jgi:uncharacterized membrane protein YkvA (DUF1232 family)